MKYKNHMTELIRW